MTTRWCGICRLGGYGDNLIASSVFPQIKKQGYNVEIITKAPESEVFEHNPYIDKISLKWDGSYGFHRENMDEFSAFFGDRGREYERFYILGNTVERLCVIKLDQPALFFSPAPFRRKLCGAPYLEVLHDLCEVPHEYAPNFFPSDEELWRALYTKSKVGERVIGWVISGTNRDKFYPYTHLAISRLIKELDVSLVMFGEESQKESNVCKIAADFVRASLGSTDRLRFAVSKEKWPLRRSLATLQQCDLVIGPDTGAMWAVAMRPMGKIVLLGHASPKNIVTGWKNTVALHADPGRVICYPCHLLHDEMCFPGAGPENPACISDIGVDDIVDAAANFLDQ